MLTFADAAAPGLALAQAIGRWGNYFNQELFGQPSDLPWAIRIAPLRRPTEYADATNGADPVFSNEGLASLVKEGAVRFFLIEGRDRKEKSVRWITDHCEQVRQQIGQSSDSTVLLHDCVSGAR